MSSLKLTLFGSSQIELNGTPVQLTTRKVLALLVDAHEFQRFLEQAYSHPHASSNLYGAAAIQSHRSSHQAGTETIGGGDALVGGRELIPNLLLGHETEI